MNISMDYEKLDKINDSFNNTRSQLNLGKGDDLVESVQKILDDNEKMKSKIEMYKRIAALDINDFYVVCIPDDGSPWIDNSKELENRKLING